MYLKQKELFWELDHDFIKQLMAITTKQTYEKGDYIFHQDDSADYFYVLIKGCVKLEHEPMNQTVYILTHSGEIFGWSSIVGRGGYSVAAKCVEPTTVNKIHRGDLIKLLNQNKENGMIFYRKIAEMLGNRLIRLYAPVSEHEYNISEGSGHLQEIVEASA